MECLANRLKKENTVLAASAVVAVLAVGLVVACAPASPATPATVAPQTAVETDIVAEELIEPEPVSAPTQTPGVIDGSLDHQALLNDVLYSRLSVQEAQAILEQIADSGDTHFVAGLIDTLRYQRRLNQDIGRSLNELTAQDLPSDWFEWVEWAGRHTEIESFPSYAGWKAELYSNVDPNFLRFLYQGVEVATGSRVEEIVWGGVTVDGIPALDNPKMLDPSEADYLVPHERVFGVSINGDTRAYPARFLDWHEMFNDIVGGEPVSLAY